MSSNGGDNNGKEENPLNEETLKTLDTKGNKYFHLFVHGSIEYCNILYYIRSIHECLGNLVA